MAVIRKTEIVGIPKKGQDGGQSGLNQGVRPSYHNFQISLRTLCTISTDCFAETPVIVSFDHILCTFWSINMRRQEESLTYNEVYFNHETKCSR